MLNYIPGETLTPQSSVEENHSLSSNITSSRKSIGRFRKMELNPIHWEICETEVVTSIPYDVNGFRKFKIECKIDDMMKKTKDGRPWGKWVNSCRTGWIGKRRVAKCKGSPVCNSDTCLYKEKYGCVNRVQFQKSASILVCFTCGSPAEIVACPGVKIWEYEANSTNVTVMYKNEHSCVAKKKKISNELIKNEVAKHPGVKPNKLVNSKIVNIMAADDFSWDDVELVAEQFVDMKQVYNAREELKMKINPMGQNFEALALYKQKCDEKDKFFIYRVNNRALNGKPSFVFKSSQAMANICLEMDRDGSGVMMDEFAFIDAKHNRCRGFKTLTLWTYHPVLRKLLSLAIMEVEEENTENLTIFWQLLNEMLEDISGKKGYKFNPFGFIADEHHANWCSIRDVFGVQSLERAVSCEFHYKQSVQRHSRKVSERSDEFIGLANALLHAQTINLFNAACEQMETFFKINNIKELSAWYKWWHDRRFHIFRAFKMENAPSSNLAEVGHAKIGSNSGPYISLLEAARVDVASAILQATEIRLFHVGVSKGGKGLNTYQKQIKDYKAGMKRAKAYADELDSEGVEIMENKSGHVPATGLHRPPEKKQRNKKLTRSTILSKKMQISFKLDNHFMLFSPAPFSI